MRHRMPVLEIIYYVLWTSVSNDYILMILSSSSTSKITVAHWKKRTWDIYQNILQNAPFISIFSKKFLGEAPQTPTSRRGKPPPPTSPLASARLDFEYKQFQSRYASERSVLGMVYKLNIWMSRQVIIANFYLKMSTTVTVLYRHFYVMWR